MAFIFLTVFFITLLAVVFILSLLQSNANYRIEAKLDRIITLLVDGHDEQGTRTEATETQRSADAPKLVSD